jgi:peptidyl-prolyl cis-trans isomerase B (cyclophilin B)
VIAAARDDNPKKESAGSQFYLVQGKVYTLMQIQELEIRLKRRNPDFKFTKEQIKAYTTIGGTPHLDGGYTVFGEVISGIEVIDKIANVKQNKALGNRPVEDVRMIIKVIYLSKK